MSGDANRRDATRELAALARLALDDDEARIIGAQLEQILAYLRSLAEVEVEGVPEYLSAEQPDSGLREDEVGPMLPIDIALSGTPAHRDGHLLVPKFKD